jgi:phosphatidylserine/phosphatidylglycerophosphate/cardiolipin synthase-like enzyme
MAIGLSVSAGAVQPGTTLADGSARVIYHLANRQNDNEIIALIRAAKTRVYFATYIFTLPDIADALVAAKKRGMKVRGLIDARESARSYERPIVEELRGAGIPLESQRHVDGDGIVHIKALVTDSAYAVGSYNWSRSATTENDEILEIGTDPATVAAYQRVLQGLLDHYAENRVPSANGRPCAAGSST